jgi:hypothetical protein
VVEVPDPDLERTGKRIGFEDSYQYLRQRGGLVGAGQTHQQV